MTIPLFSALQKSVMLSLLVAIPLMFAACPRGESPTSANSAATPQPAATTTSSAATSFDADRAMAHVKKQLDFGPRPPGSPELAKTRAYIIDQLKSSGVSVSTDEFNASTPLGQRNMVNVIAEIPGESKDVIMVSSHYDSKYFKDMTFLGANDPGASVGALLELVRVVAGNTPKPKLTYWFVFFDGEEALCRDWDQCGKPDAPDNTYGSRHFVEKLKKDNQTSRVRAMILYDMMGYKDLELGRDTMSVSWLQNIFWQTGRELGHANVFVDREEGVGGDDHEPFLKAGIDSLDIIQLSNYPYWHTADDTIDKVSPKSLKIVGDVTVASLPKVEQYLINHPQR